MWDLPGPGLEPVSPALAGRFSTTAPQGKPQNILKLIKSLGVHLTRKVYDLYMENCKTLLTVIKKDYVNGEKYHVYGLEDNIKMACLTKLIYRLSEIPVKMLASFSMEIDKTTLKFIVQRT